MTDKDLKRLRRDELLEMLIAQSKRTEQLERELDEARAALQSRDIFLEERPLSASTACSRPPRLLPSNIWTISGA